MGYQRRVHGDSIAKTFHQSKKMRVLLMLLITLAVCTMHTYAAPKTFLIETADAGLDYGGRPNDLDMAGDDYWGRSGGYLPRDPRDILHNPYPSPWLHGR